MNSIQNIIERLNRYSKESMLECFVIEDPARNSGLLFGAELRQMARELGEHNRHIACTLTIPLKNEVIDFSVLVKPEDMHKLSAALIALHDRAAAL